MGYLKEFQSQIASRDFAKFMHLWEEYCTCDTADVEELKALLKLIKASDFAKQFGNYIEAILPLWQTIADESESYEILKLLFDLQTTNSGKLAELALTTLQKRYSNDPNFNERLRLVGLRTKENFPSALSNFDLLAHIKKGNFVYHLSGWGTGEIMDQSTVREQLAVEFENVTGIKHITFSNAFKTLVPLSSDHFYARRFADPDKLEKEAKENPLEVIKCLLRDLGPKTAAEIKDELCELVIPEKDWQKWWQNVRAKLKKDTEIESPENPRDPFSLRKVAISHEMQFLESLKKKKHTDEILITCYNFIRDHAAKIKQAEIKSALLENLKEVLTRSALSNAQALEAYFCLGAISDQKYDDEVGAIIKESDALVELIDQIEIIAYKKQAMVAIRAFRKDWPKQFISLLHHITQGPLRDYLFKELSASEHNAMLIESLKEILGHPESEPDFFLWYFLKLLGNAEEGLPFGDKKGQCQFVDSFLVLLHKIENDPSQKETVKKMYVALTNKRYALVRQIFEGSTVEFAKEFLLLASKCHTLTDHDLKILRSLAEVPHPSIASPDKHKAKAQTHDHTIWTTEKGYLKMQERIKQIGTKEVVDNAREIEAARALGDLRENSEYKAAQERRSRLQSELKSLSDQFSKARIITPDDVTTDTVGIGAVIEATDSKGEKTQFTILGPWEADADANVLSFQSKLAQSMMGLKLQDQFKFKDEEYTIQKIKTIFGT